MPESRTTTPPLRTPADPRFESLAELPGNISPGDSFRLDTNHHEPYSHYLFRFPSKFHPPLARSIIERYSSVGDIVLDPAVGSGTALVESLVLGRSAIGIDVDPLSCFLSRVKTTRLEPSGLAAKWHRLEEQLAALERPGWRYEKMKFPGDDISVRTFSAQARGLSIPPIPNIDHWFRRYVVIDLARIKKGIEELDASNDQKAFFYGCFAAIIRRASNADPIPVSGLEVTKHMRALDKKGRIINPFALFRQKVPLELAGAKTFFETVSSTPDAAVIEGSALDLRRIWRDRNLPVANLIVTSPPYCNAVEYHRRHKLEMYWLDLVGSQSEVVTLSRRYIGRRWGHGVESDVKATPQLGQVLRDVARVSPHKVRPLTSYFAEIDGFLVALRSVLVRGGRCVVVIGNSRTKDYIIPTHDIFRELGERHMELELAFSYEIRNRYMQYFRHNGADIKQDHVLVFRKR